LTTHRSVVKLWGNKLLPQTISGVKMADENVIKFSAFKRRKIEAVTSTPAHKITQDQPTKKITEIVNETLAAMMLELENEGVDSEHAKMLMRARIIGRLLEETLAEMNGAPMSDWMKKLLTHF